MPGFNERGGSTCCCCEHTRYILVSIGRTREIGCRATAGHFRSPSGVCDFARIRSPRTTVIMAGQRTLFIFLIWGFLFVVSQSLVVPGDADISLPESLPKRPFELMEVYYSLYYMFGFNGTWISDTEIMIRSLINGDVSLYDVTTGESKVIFEDHLLPDEYKFSIPHFSSDRQYILFAVNVKAAFRHSKVSNYVVYDVKRGSFTKIANGSKLFLALWSPVANDLVYIDNNDIYQMTFEDGRNSVRRLTTTGVQKVIFNGMPDWVYEEEVFSSATAMWYSPDGRHLAFATFNDTVVKEMAFVHYGVPGSLEYQYPTEFKIKYPKVGTPNPVVSLSVIDLTDPSSEVVDLKAPVDVIGSDNVLFTVSWWDSSHVIATWTNRVQNQSQIVMYDTQGDSVKVLYDEETDAWVQPMSPIRVGDYALLLKWKDSGTSAGKFRHVTRYEYNDQLASPVDLTPGPSEVHSILKVDSKRGKVYYLATAPGQPTQRNLYSVPLDGSEKPTCISCEYVTPEGNMCTYATASFSTEASHYALTCSGPDPHTITIHDENHQQISVLNDNELVRMLLSLLLMPLQRDFNITVNGYDSRVRLFLPPDFDESKSYPMLVFVYGGPNTVRIIDHLIFGYEYYMSTNRRVIYAWIDARGSAFKGSKMLREIYRKMGTVEIEDTIAVTEVLQKRYSWIDAKRTGVWGWSYGGFHTGMVLATDKDSVFKCGISVAPVTSWIYYDSIYTERFMGLPIPEDNLAGYNRTDISRVAEGIRGKRYMLIHGTGDDNVHYQQAMALVKSLEHLDILFEQVTYTDESHGMTYVTPHLYHTMDKFWTECFNLEPPVSVSL